MRALAVCGLVAIGLLAVTVVFAATPNDPQPGQRIDLKVLLLSADGTEPGFAAWKAELDREGVPYDTLVAFNGQTRAATLTDAQLADYGANHAKYQAVILAGGDLGHVVNNPGGTTSFLSAFTDAEWTALARFERTFGIRRLSDFTAPSPLHGLNVVGGATVDGTQGTLTAAGKAAFPYLKGPIPFPNDAPNDAEAFGYPATPVNAADWQTLVAAPTPGAAYLGIYTHPDDGREEMVMTVASNQFQTHNWALRHGMLTWVTRGVFLGYQRAYLGLDVDDIFLGDDKWNPATHTTDYDFASAIRMTPADVDTAVAWQQRTGLQMAMVYNLGGVDLYGGAGADQLLAKFQQTKNQFRWINHTLEHPNLDCTTANYTRNQIAQNQTRFNQGFLTGLAPGLNDPTELVTGEHSGLANTRPGNPGTIDPPAFDDAAVTAGTLAAGTYDYGITASSTRGETPASVTQVVLAAAGGVTLSWPAVCHAVSYSVYRRPAGGAWTRLATLPQPVTPFGDAGPAEVTYPDSGAAVGAAGDPPASNGAALDPYPQNPQFVAALTQGGTTTRTIASDASKDYPNPPAGVLGGGTFPKGASFVDGPARAVPRYPSNVYYNVANRADQLDEYNWIYTAPAGGGGCVPITGVTTCNPAKVTWAQYLDSETRIMLGHLTGNDPRPHYFHQTNIAQADPNAATDNQTVGGTLYAVMDTLIARYEGMFDRTSVPLVQLTHRQVADTLAQQDAWAATRTAGSVSAWLQDGVVHVANTGAAAVDVPVTGTTAGSAYGGQRSGWITLAPGAEQALEPADPAKAAAPAVTGTPKVGERLTATGGTWTGTPEIARRLRWQRCEGTTCTAVAGATGETYDVTAADLGSSLRVVVTAGNWISAVGLAVSPRTAVVTAVKPSGGKPGAGGGEGGAGQGGGGPAGKPHKARKRLALTRVRMSPRRFAVARRKPKAGTRLDGAAITWRLNRRATVRLTFQRARGKGHSRRWVKVGAIKRKGKAGAGVVRFRGRFGSRLLAPGRYRVVVKARHAGQRSGPERMRFKVVRR